MGEYTINGGRKIVGQTKPGGAKNAVLPILAAAAMMGEECCIANAPRISDTLMSLDILHGLGCTAEYDRSSIIINSSGLCNATIPNVLSGKMRSSILFMGALLGRCGEAKIGLPGGCPLGARKFDYHIDALTAMGAKITENTDYNTFDCIVPSGKLVGCTVRFPTPSVGATENVMLSAVFAEGETIIENAAREPEIIDLADFLIKSGAKIKGAGTGRIVIKGISRSSTKPACHHVIPDRIIAGTYLCAAAMTGGELLLTDIRQPHMVAITEKLHEAGCEIKLDDDFVWLRAPERLVAVNVETAPFPGFPTDMQAQFMAMQCISQGSSLIRETIFDKRDKHIEELAKMGAHIASYDDNSKEISGVEGLSGAVTYAEDLRGGAALILAGLAADGVTIVKNSHHVERGYENIDLTLNELGADVVLHAAS